MDAIQLDIMGTRRRKNLASYNGYQRLIWEVNRAWTGAHYTF